MPYSLCGLEGGMVGGCVEGMGEGKEWELGLAFFKISNEFL